MPILDNLFGPNVRNYQRALDRATQRNSVLAGNLANVDTPGYKRRDMDFAIQLEDAQGELEGSPLAAIKAKLNRGYAMGGSVRIDGNSVDLEREVGAIAETELRYNMLTEMTSRYFSNLKTVIREGR